ncbi:MAG: hypothetical protein ABW107_04475 [Candidatus Thiodiazotropha sp. 6PLUC5]
MIFRSIDWEARCHKILDHFQNHALRFYDEKHRECGGIPAIDRAGNQQFYDIISISIGVIQVNYNYFTSHKEVASISSEAKKQAKKIKGNSLFIDRRSYQDAFTTSRYDSDVPNNVVSITPPNSRQ